MTKPVLTAVAWPYANGPRHIGHVSGFGVPSDVFSRYQRMVGNDVLMVSGTDEHGTPLLVQADKEGMNVHDLADRYNRVIVNDLAGLGLSYDLFTRTTTRNHYAVVQEMFRTVAKNGYLFTKKTTGAISPSTGRTLPDRYIEGTCPICGYEGARGDQCDNCGNQLDPSDLINPVSKINGETPKFVETEHWFLDLPALADALGDWLRGRKDWRPNVLKFSLNILDDIKPRAMSRDIDWGIPIPIEGWQDRNDKRLYVWFDAVVDICLPPLNGRTVLATRMRGANGGTIPKPSATTSWVKTTSPSTAKSGRQNSSPTTATAVGRANTACWGTSTFPRRLCPRNTSPCPDPSSPPLAASSSM